MNRWTPRFAAPLPSREICRSPAARSFHPLPALLLGTVLAATGWVGAAAAQTGVTGPGLMGWSGAQPLRQFPPQARLAELTVANSHEVLLDGRPVRLSPGSRIRGVNNALVVSGALVGQTFMALFTTDTMGQVHEVWALSPQEVQRITANNRLKRTQPESGSGER